MRLGLWRVLGILQFTQTVCTHWTGFLLRDPVAQTVSLTDSGGDVVWIVVFVCRFWSDPRADGCVLQCQTNTCDTKHLQRVRGEQGHVGSQPDSVTVNHTRIIYTQWERFGANNHLCLLPCSLSVSNHTFLTRIVFGDEKCWLHVKVKRVRSNKKHSCRSRCPSAENKIRMRLLLICSLPTN